MHSLTRMSRTPPGVRELKRRASSRLYTDQCRTPPGVRELKLKYDRHTDGKVMSHPSRGA